MDLWARVDSGQGAMAGSRYEFSFGPFPVEVRQVDAPMALALTAVTHDRRSKGVSYASKPNPSVQRSPKALHQSYAMHARSLAE